MTGDDGARSVLPVRSGELPAPPVDETTASGYLRALRALKQWSGFTYRQLQRRAEGVGDALPHSTVAAALGRNTLPRQDLVRAFVRACGADEPAVEAWLATRNRIVAANEAATAETAVPGARPAGSPAATTAVGDPSGGEAQPTRQAGPGATAAAGGPADWSSSHRPMPAPAEPAEHAGSDDTSASDGSVAPSVLPLAGPAAVVGNTASAGGTPPVGDVFSAGGLSSGVARGRLAAVTRARRGDQWIGLHRHDPADEVPKPSGLGWLLPPIMYRTGWASRVLSVGMVLLLALVAIGVVARALRDGGESDATTGSPSAPVVEAPVGDPVPSESVAVPSGSVAVPSGSVAPAGAATTPGVGPTRSAARPTGPDATRAPTGGRTTKPPVAPAPPAQPYLTASTSAFCRSGGSWAFSISGQLHNASVGYDPTGKVDHQDGTVYGYPINGDGSTSFSGAVPPRDYGEDRLTLPATEWTLEVYVNGDMMTGTRISVSGTVSRPPSC